MVRTVILLALCIYSTAAAADEALVVDPMLLKEIETVRGVIAGPDNPLWPGWDAGDTPLMVYLPGRQEVLINHTQPPDGFIPYEGPLSFGGMRILYRDGETSIKWDGQNTSTDIYGVETLVLADVLSNRKQWMRGWAADPRPAEEKFADLPYDKLRVDPYEQLAMIAHEAFHVFQANNLSEKATDERLVRLYPCLSVKNNVGFALEGEALDDCLHAESDGEFRDAAVRWLAIRRDRRSGLPDKAIAYEDGNEFIEGTAKYIELTLMEALQGTKPDPALLWEQGFTGFDDLGWFRERRLDDMIGNLRGEVNVNNDPYGTSPVRGRLYFSGMAIAAMLDRIDPDWKETIGKEDVTLTGLAERALDPDEDELARALDEAKSGPDYDTLVVQKKRLAEEGEKDTGKMLDGILNGPNTLLVVDYSKLDTSKIGIAFTAFGVRAVDAERTIYTLVPIWAAMGSEAYTFDQSVPIPTYQDRESHQFKFQLGDSMTPAQVARLLGAEGDGPWTQDGVSLDLPGVKVEAKRARISHDGSSIVIQFLPEGGDEG
jgi:hypothetical protein